MFKESKRRKNFRLIAEDTDKFSKENDFGTVSKHIKFDETISGKPLNMKNNEKTLFKVLDESCVKTVIDLGKEYSNIGLMNFASANNVGGGYLSGANAQEEAIARASNLGNEQEKFYEEHYVFNRKNNNFGLYNGNYIYSKNAMIFKNDDGEYLDKFVPVDIMTISAPNVSRTENYPSEVSKADVREALRTRIDHTLREFADNGCEHLVLGAFGCGVFKNSPTDVAKIFRQRFAEGGEFHNTFKTVTFSVIKGKWSNYDVFKHYFIEKEISHGN